MEGGLETYEGETVTLAFQGHYGRIVSMAPGDRDPDAEWSPSTSLGGGK